VNRILIDGMLTNSQLIHHMCLFVEQQANKTTGTVGYLKPSPLASQQPQSALSTSSNSNRSPRTDMQRKMEIANRMSSTSYGKSFSESVGIAGGNQIQIVHDDEIPAPVERVSAPTFTRQVSSPSDVNLVVSGFSEMRLRE
jgi:hypothetical protein